MSTRTIEVEIDEAGLVHAVDPRVSIPAGPALLTPLGASRGAPARDAATQPPEDWRALVGILGGSPNWREPAQTIQERLRAEWR